jgi:iron complex transport system ATP-binding protein
VMMQAGRIVCSGVPETVFTAQNIKTVFDLDANVLRDPVSGRLFCMPTRGEAAKAAVIPALATT